MQKLRALSRSKESNDSSDVAKPPTPKIRDFSFNLHTGLNLSPSPNSNFTPPSSPTVTTSESTGKLSPELAPIVSLLSAQSHRKYCEGVFMLLKDLDADGNPSDRKWLEVYGIMIGNEVAYWDSSQLDASGSVMVGNNKPSYLNFSDGTLKTCSSLASANGNIDNVIVLSTTLKNRFLLQYSSDEDFATWCSSFRLSAFEYKTLQEAYTASLLSARGSLLSDIRVILSEKKFNYEDWTSVRFGAGMPWKRCFAVIEPSKKTRKGYKNGFIYFYENEKKNKKTLMAKITNISSVYALYPRTYTIIDKSTLIKLEGSIQFDPKEGSKNCSIFLMPEQHTSVPGYDTLIRFLIPLMDSFHLYGRPKRLNADKLDPNSLLFGLPVLPRVHYLEVKDLISITKKGNSIDWDQEEWNSAIKDLLKTKVSNGYSGCGSADGVNGALDLLNSSKDMADGKIKFFVNKPEVSKYLENSPHARSMRKFSSSEEHTLNTSTPTSVSNSKLNLSERAKTNIRITNESDADNDQNDSLYSKGNSLSPRKSAGSNPNTTPLHTNSLPKNSPSPQVVNIYQKYSQIPDSSKIRKSPAAGNLEDTFKKTTLYDDDEDDDDDYKFNRISKGSDADFVLAGPPKNATVDELYPSHGDILDDDDEEDDDAENSSFDFVMPKSNPERILSPFTDFNNNVKKAMNVENSYVSSRTIPTPSSNNEKLVISKQRSPQRRPPPSHTNNDTNGLYQHDKSSYPLDESKKVEYPNATANRYFSNPTISTSNNRSLSDRAVAQSSNHKPENLYSTAPVNPYLNNQQSPKTPIDQQNPPPLPPAKQGNYYLDHNDKHSTQYPNRQTPQRQQQQQQQQRAQQYGYNKNPHDGNLPPKPPPHDYNYDSPISEGYSRVPPPAQNLNYTNSPELVPPHQYKHADQKHNGKNSNVYYNPQRSASNPLNSPSTSSFEVYGPMKSHSPVLNQQGFSRNQPPANGGPLPPAGYNQYNNRGYGQQPQQPYQTGGNVNSYPHHYKNNVPVYPGPGDPQYAQQQVAAQQQQQLYPSSNPHRLRHRPPPPKQQQQQPQQAYGKSFKHDPYAIAKAPGRN